MLIEDIFFFHERAYEWTFPDQHDAKANISSIVARSTSGPRSSQCLPTWAL